MPWKLAADSTNLYWSWNLFFRNSEDDKFKQTQNILDHFLLPLNINLLMYLFKQNAPTKSQILPGTQQKLDISSENR